MPEDLANGLRDHVRETVPELGALADNLWRVSEDIHNRQNGPDSNENGRKHVEKVESNIWRLLTETVDANVNRNLGRFEAHELFLLSCAACCHDFDKALKSKLPGGFVHGEGSGSFLMNNANALGLTRPWANAVARVISIHDRKTAEFQDGLQELKTDHATPERPVDLRRLAVLLKAADILHTDNSRISELAVAPQELEGLDRDKYFARYCTNGWTADGRRITLQADAGDVQQASALNRCFEYMRDHEWTAVADGLERYGFPHELHLHNMGVRDSSDVLEIVAVRPEDLARELGQLSRLTVIDNGYVDFGTKSIGGVSGALSRIYVAPADAGKTRAAAEWVREVTALQPESWVVLLSKNGTIPTDEKRILLDRDRYDSKGDPLPHKAVLLLDDLPDRLPPDAPEASVAAAVQRLFQWFQNYPGFQQRRVVGTIRNESIQSRPDWPDVLPSLGEELELLSLTPPNDQKRRELWNGMSSGAIFQAQKQQLFSMQIEEQFVDAVAEKSTNAEAVAFFVRAAAAKNETKLRVADAEGFSQSAVQTWLGETWPAVLAAYGTPARVFHTLARFLEAGLRPGSGFITGVLPAWEFHEAFGPDLCQESGCAERDYLTTIDQMGRDGHAVGNRGQWIRPIWDFLLQSDLPGVELDLPELDWFVQRTDRLSHNGRIAFASHLSAAEVEVDFPTADDAWYFGWARGRFVLAERATDKGRRAILRDEEVDYLRKAVEANPKNDDAWFLLGLRLGQEADREEDAEKRRKLRDEAIACFRKAVEVNLKHDDAWFFLGGSLGSMADGEEDAEKRRKLRDEAIGCYRKAVEANLKHDGAWFLLGGSLGLTADGEEDAEKRRTLRREEIACYRKAVQANPKNDKAWHYLGVRLAQETDGEEDAKNRRTLRDEEIACYRKAVEANPQNDKAWYNLGVILGQEADREEDAEKRQKLRDEEIACYEKAVEANPQNDEALHNLGVSLRQEADREEDAEKRQKLRDEAIACYRKAVEANPKNDDAWGALGVRLGQEADREEDAEKRQKLRDEEIVCYRKAVEANPQNDDAWHNLGVRLGREAKQEEDAEQRRTLRDEEIACYREAVEANPENDESWHGLGVRLGQEADQEEDAGQRRTLRDEEIACYRKAVEANPKHDKAWYNLGVRLGQEADREEDAEKRQKLRDEAIACYRKAVEANLENENAWYSLSANWVHIWRETGERSALDEALDAARKAASLGDKRYNLACTLALTGETDEALDEFEGCLDRGEVDRSHVAQDPDWDGLREHPRYVELMKAG